MSEPALRAQPGPGSPWQLGVLVPVTIACAFAADVTLRLLPHDLFSFRAWEALGAPGEDVPFLTNRRYQSDRTYGNLAAVGNVRSLRHYHSVTLTTDELGYPNPPGLAARGAATAIVFGSSFAAGSELGDGKTFAARLSTVTGRAVYNAGGGRPSFGKIRSLARRLVAPGGFVIFEYPEAREVPPITPVRVGYKRAWCLEVLAARRLSAVCPMLGWASRHAKVSPLQILSQHAVKLVQDGQWLPNPYASLVLRGRLRNGQDMLFTPQEVAFFHQGTADTSAVRYFRWLSTKLRGDGLTLLVVMVPRKYTIYAPLLWPPDPGPEASVAYLQRIERALRAAGIPVVNLTSPYRAAAAAELERGGYIYFPDDTHWNVAGAAVAAREVARVWDEVLVARRGRSEKGSR